MKLLGTNVEMGSKECPNLPVYIVPNYTVDQAGQEIREENVVRPDNRKWSARDAADVREWRQRTTAGCPTYGSCCCCYRSGPVGKTCIDCTIEIYQVLIPGRRYIIDSITLAAVLNKGHEIAKADHMCNWLVTPTQWTNGHDGVQSAIRRKYSYMTDVDEAARIQLETNDFHKFLDFYNGIW